jgi:hypothetical protein
MSRHNIVGSEVFATERLVYILRTYPRRGGWRGYALAAASGGILAFLLAGVLAFARSMIGVG